MSEGIPVFAAVTLSGRQDGDASGQKGECEYRSLLPRSGRPSLLDFLSGLDLSILVPPLILCEAQNLSHHRKVHPGPVLCSHILPPPFLGVSFSDSVSPQPLLLDGAEMVTAQTVPINNLVVHRQLVPGILLRLTFLDPSLMA